MELLKKLVDAFGMPGWESEVRDVIKEELEGYADSIYVDRIGNVIAVKNPDAKGKAITLTTHMDEAGLMVRSIDHDGFIRFSSWEIDKRALAAQRVRVGEKKALGVVGAKPVHALKPGERKKIPPHATMYIDIGARSKEEAMAVTSVGEYIGFDVEFQEFGEGKVVGRSLDARVGCAAIIKAFKDPACCRDNKLTAVFTAQKMVGFRGASVAANQVKSDLLISLDGYESKDDPSAQGVARPGKGPAVVIKDRLTLYPRPYADSVMECAKKHNIPCQLLYTTADKGDSGALQRAFGGTPVIGITVPVKNPRTPAAMMEKSDYENTVSLLKSYLSEL